MTFTMLVKPAFFYKMLANRTYNFGDETVQGSKHLNSKDRLSLLLCMNMTGTDKHPPPLIGKAARPHSQKKKGVGLSKLKVNYYHNSNRWMTAVAFEHWLDKWNERLARQKWHILLLIDHIPSNITKEYANIRVEFLTPKHHIKAATTRSGHNTCLQNALLHYHQQQTGVNVGQWKRCEKSDGWLWFCHSLLKHTSCLGLCYSTAHWEMLPQSWLHMQCQNSIRARTWKKCLGQHSADLKCPGSLQWVHYSWWLSGNNWKSVRSWNCPESTRS